MKWLWREWALFLLFAVAAVIVYATWRPSGI